MMKHLIRYTIILFSFVPFLQAHPLGIFSLNRYARIELAGELVRLVYVVDIAEIPSIQEIESIDLNHDGKLDTLELGWYSANVNLKLRDRFALTLDGKAVALQEVKHDLSFPQGQGGMKTIRYSPVFEGSLPKDQLVHSLNYVDKNFNDRMGWKEIVVRPMNGEVIRESSVSQNDLTDELRNYPADRLTRPLTMSEANVKFIPGTLPAQTASSLTGSLVEKAKDGFADLISTKELSPPVMIVSLLIALMLGAGHALTPGHGKTIVAAYLVGQRGTAKHAAFLGFTVTATHTIGVFAMGLIALFASQYILPEKLFPWLGLLSGLLVVGIGASLIRKRYLLAIGRGDHDHAGQAHSHEPDHHDNHEQSQKHDHRAKQPGGKRHHHHDKQSQSHEHHQHSHGGHVHSHLPPGAGGEPVSWKSLFALGVSGGLVPCPSAIVVLLSAIALGRIGFGLLLIVAFSIGLAGVLTGIGLLMVYARKFFERFNTSGPVVSWLPVISAVAVTIAGAIITMQAFVQTGVSLHSLFIDHPLSLADVVQAGSLSILGLGFVLGLKHALDADHLIAVSTIVSERKGFWSSSIVGALWGLGHTASLLIVGLIVIAFHFPIPGKIATAMEFGVALMLIILGGNVLWKVRKGAAFHMHTHQHNLRVHVHPHLHEQAVAGDHEKAHTHSNPKIGKKPFLVGMVHGIAGSAALMLVVLATISSRTLALLYIAIFGIGSVGGMFLMSALIGLPFAFTSKHDRLNKIVRISAGVISVSFGLFYAWQIGILGGLFS